MASEDSKIKDTQPEESRPLTKEEKEAIEDLKKIAEEKGFTADAYDDVMLIRFVRGYWNEKERAEKTKEMFVNSLEWRKEIGAADVCDEPLPREEEWMKLWPYDFIGKDKRGHPVYYERTSFFDPAVLTTSFSEKEIQRYHMLMQETMAWLKEKQTRESGYLTYKSTVIMDLQDFGRKHLSSSFYGILKKIINIDQYYYPETLYKFYIINAPFIFQMLWSVVKPMLHPVTASRISLMGGVKEYLPKLKELMDESEIPRYLGGKNEDHSAEGIDKMIDVILKKHTAIREERKKYYAEKKKSSEAEKKEAAQS